MPTPRPTKEIVDAAILGFEEQKRRLDAQIAELRGLLPNGQMDTVRRDRIRRRARREE
jgi:hypothetical protein